MKLLYTKQEQKFRSNSSTSTLLFPRQTKERYVLKTNDFMCKRHLDSPKQTSTALDVCKSTTDASSNSPNQEIPNDAADADYHSCSNPEQAMLSRNNASSMNSRCMN